MAAVAPVTDLVNLATGPDVTATVLRQIVPVAPDHRPDLSSQLASVCAAFGVPVPDLYLCPGYDDIDLGGSLLCLARPSLLLGGRLIVSDAPAPPSIMDEIAALIAHECATPLFGHSGYRMVAMLLGALPAPVPLSPATPPWAASFRSAPDVLREALAHWGAVSRLSADRAAAVYLGDADAVTRLLFRGGAGEDAAVRVREIQAWASTSGFHHLVERVRADRPGPAVDDPIR